MGFFALITFCKFMLIFSILANSAFYLLFFIPLTDPVALRTVGTLKLEPDKRLYTSSFDSEPFDLAVSNPSFV